MIKLVKFQTKLDVLKNKNMLLNIKKAMFINNDLTRNERVIQRIRKEAVAERQKSNGRINRKRYKNSNMKCMNNNGSWKNGRNSERCQSME